MLPCYCLRSIGEESFAQEIFEEHVLHLQEKAKEKERKREEEKVTALVPYAFTNHFRLLYGSLARLSNEILKPTLCWLKCYLAPASSSAT